MITALNSNPLPVTDPAVVSRLLKLRELVAQKNALHAARNPLYWMTHLTKTSDKQVKAAMADKGYIFDIHGPRIETQEEAAIRAAVGERTSDGSDSDTAARPFPKWEFLAHYIATLHMRKIVAPYKSRTMMMSWATAAHCLHTMAERPHTEVIIQSADEARSIELLEMMKTLYANTDPALRIKWKCDKDVHDQAVHIFEMSNGSRAVALACGPAGPDKIRSYHPTIYVVDEAAFVPELEGCRTNALSARAMQLIFVTTPNPGVLEDWYQDSRTVDWPIDVLTHANELMEDIGMKPSLSTEKAERLMKAGKPIRTLCNGGLEMKVSGNDTVFLWLNYRARPDITQAEIDKLKQSYTSYALWRKEMENDASALGGQRVFPEYDPSLHECEDHEVPEEGCIFMALDPHPRTPHAMLWVLVDKYSDVWFYRELWPSKQYGRSKPLRDDEDDNIYTVKEYCDTIAQLEGNQYTVRYENTNDEYGEYLERASGERVCRRFMDQAGKGFNTSGEGQKEISYAKKYSILGLKFSDPTKSHQAGYDAIHEYLVPRQHEIHGLWPRLHIAKSLTELRMEMVNHKYRPTSTGSREKELDQRAIDYRSHMIDLVRYLLASRKIYYHPSEASRRRVVYIGPDDGVRRLGG